jgi:hypothetical protein
MAQTFAKLTKYAGSRDVWGGHGVVWMNYTGVSSYVNSGTFATSGEIIDAFGGPSQLVASSVPLRNIDAIPNVQTVSGLYEIRFFPSALGPTRRWLAHWYTIISAGVEVSNAVSLSAESAIVMVIGG